MSELGRGSSAEVKATGRTGDQVPDMVCSRVLPAHSLRPRSCHLLVASLSGIPESKHQTLTGKALSDEGEGGFDPMAQEPSSTKQPRQRTEDCVRILTRILP